MIDREGRLFGRVNLVDLVIVLLVVAFAGRLAFSWWVQKPAVDQSNPTITFTALVQAVRQPTADAIHVGDVVYDTRSNALLGTVTAVRIEAAPVLEQHEDGTQTERLSKVYKDVYVTIRGTGRSTPTAVMVGSVQIHIGTPLKFQTRIWGVEGVIWDIQLGGGSS